MSMLWQAIVVPVSSVSGMIHLAGEAFVKRHDLQFPLRL